MLEALRAVNDADEIDAIRAAAVLADEALEEVLAGGIVGRTERDVALALELEIAIRRRGAEGVSFFRRDSAYGGKTGIDLPEAKNYVGAYHQPAAFAMEPHVPLLTVRRSGKRLQKSGHPVGPRPSVTYLGVTS